MGKGPIRKYLRRKQESLKKAHDPSTNRDDDSGSISSAELQVHTKVKAKDIKEASTNALAASSDIFTPRPRDIDTCAWYVRTVEPSSFCYPTPASIELPKIFGHRALEYAGTWVEHYYYELVVVCRQQNQMGFVRMLYNWYIAQFTIDYLNDVFPLTSEQYLASSALRGLPYKGLFDPSIKRRSNKIVDNIPCLIQHLKKRKVSSVLMASRQQMQFHEAALNVLPQFQRQRIRKALQGFYDTVVTQFGTSQTDLFEKMSLKEYYDFRSLNAGGEMGFLRQTYLFSLLDTEASLGDEAEIEALGRVVGRNIALVNDLYGLKKDVLTGDVNILLKHHHEHNNTNDSNNHDASIAWAVEEIKDTVRIIEQYYQTHPHHLVTKYNIAMGCVSGNHGAHATCKRFELPDNFEWPTSL